MWDLPRPGLEPVSPALAGRLLTTAPPGSLQLHSFLCRGLTQKLLDLFPDNWFLLYMLQFEIVSFLSVYCWCKEMQLTFVFCVFVFAINLKTDGHPYQKCFYFHDIFVSSGFSTYTIIACDHLNNYSFNSSFLIRIHFICFSWLTTFFWDFNYNVK